MITEPKFNSSPQYSVKQALNLAVFSNAAAITEDNDTDLTQVGVVYVGGDGDVKVTTINGQTVTFKNMAAGTFLPCVVKRVFDTDTTAVDLVLCY